ncbi:MFS transporter [Pyrobaculum aerophilum]|uniref:Drug resistance protein, conjectural n=2 Tax=Pyrobaculum aerophilum TaxID=13773 RepID=Q8ZVA8_PYRAE|nr:MFS transporter [Pyrobaculum aerophilum]AAL64148.1 drug resistance protein, conjectural [Pyrobaculum aerophilum str. IM2]MCX8137050.1 MFS transporter [Pyrobaculum aerophilum]HII47089.1 MFS transporter [Pyrobaculum aerophilum]
MESTSLGTSTSRADLRAYAIFSAPYSLVVFLLPFYIFKLGGGGVEVGFAFSIYATAVVAVRPVAGYLTDRLGRRSANLLGGLILASAMILLGASYGVFHIYISLFLAGAASSLINVATVAYITDVGGLENPALYSKMRIAAAIGAVGGGAFIPIAYFLDKLWGYEVAFRASALALAFITLTALPLLPHETMQLAARYKQGNLGLATCVTILAFLLGLASGLYGPQVLPYIYTKYNLSPFSAVLAYLPAVFSWLYGPRLARPAPTRVILGVIAMATGLLAMYNAPNPLLFSMSWVLESLGYAIVSTSLDQSLSRYVSGAYWGRGYGVYQAVNNLGYAIGAAFSGYVPNPFYNAIAPLIFMLPLAVICVKSRRISPRVSTSPLPS